MKKYLNNILPFKIIYVDTDSCICATTSENLDELIFEPLREVWETKYRKLVMEDKHSNESQFGLMKLEG